MMRRLYRLFSVLFVSVSVVACGNSDSPENRSINSSRSGFAQTFADDSACALVLVPLPGSATQSSERAVESITRYQKAVANTSQPLHALERLGWAFVAMARATRDAGYYRLAQQVAICMESQAADSAESLLLRGHALHNLHRFGDAERVARRLVDQRGLWFDFALLGDVLMERGALEEAANAYQAMADQRPGPQSYARIAQLRWIKGDLDGALEMMAHAVRTTSSRTPEAAAWVHVRLALLLMQLDELDVTDEVLTRALALQPGYAPALHALGRLRLAQQRTPEAIHFLERAVRADPLPEFRWTLYEALELVGRAQAAAEQKAALLRLGEVEDRRTLALFMASVGEASKRALVLALQELEVRQDVYTLDAVAWSYSNAGEHAKALDFSRRALAEGTRDARLLFHAGLIALRAGDDAQGRELLREAEAFQHMLLPSERRQLRTEFAVSQPRIPTLVNGCVPHRDRFVF